MSKKRHNFFRLCSLVLAFMLTFTNMPAVAYATDGYSAEALVEDTAEASENDAITEDGEIEESEPAVSDDELPAEDPAEDAEAAEELAEETGEEEELDGDMGLFSDEETEEEIIEEDMSLFATDVYMVDFYRAENSLIISVEVPKDNKKIDPEAIPDPASPVGPFECWVEYDAENKVINRFSKAELIAMSIERDYDLYPEYAEWVNPSFENPTVTVAYGDAIANTLQNYGEGNIYALSVADETDPKVVSINDNVITPIGLGTTTIKATVMTPVYKTKVGEATYTLTITTKAINVKAADVTATYDGSEKVGNGVDAIVGLATGDTVTASVINGKRTDAGTQALTVESVTIKHGDTDVTNCYARTYQPGTLTIEAREVAVVWDNTTVASTGETQKPDASENDEVVDVQFVVKTYSDEDCTEEVDAKEYGSYWALATEASGNFTLTNAKTTFTITGKAMEVSADPVTKTYDGTPASIVVTAIDALTKETIENPIVYYSLEEDSGYTLDQPAITDVTSGTTVYFQVKKSTYENVTGSVVVKIEPKEPALSVEQDDWTYGTDSIPAPKHATKESDGAITYEYYKIVEVEGSEPSEVKIEGVPVNVGEYKVKAKQVAHGNYTAKEAMSDKFEIEKAPSVEPAADKKAKKADNFTYNTQEHNLVIAGEAPAGTYYYYAVKAGSKPADEPAIDQFTTDVPKGTDAGNYYVYCYIQGDDNHLDGDIEYLGVVVGNKGDLTDITATITSNKWTYGAEAGIPGISDATITEGITYYYNTTDSTVDGTIWSDTDKPTDAGSYYLYAKIAATDNYNAYTTATVPFTIEKKEITVVWSNTEINSDGDPKKPTASEEDPDYEVTFTVATYKDEACEQPALAIEEGTYYAKATASDNYVLSGNTKKFTVIGRLMHVAATPVVKVYDGNAATIVVTATDGVTDIPISSFNVTYSLKENEGYSETQPVVKDVPGATIYFKVTSSTYAEAKGSTTITITGKDPGLTVSLDNWKYGETAKTPSSDSQSDATISYTYYKIVQVEGQEPTEVKLDEKPTNAGDYKIKATQPAKDNYAADEAFDTFTIAKADSVQPTGDNKATKADDFTYNTEAHNLVKTGTAPAGTYYYHAVAATTSTKPTTDPEIADITSTSSPTGTEPGYYHVYCYIKGDDNHLDGAVEYLGVVQGKKRTRTGITASVSGWTYGAAIGKPSISDTKITEGVAYYYNTTNSTTGGTAWNENMTLNAGKYYLYATIAESTYDYAFTTATSEFTVAQKPLTYTVSDASIVYNSTHVYTESATIDAGQMVGQDTAPSWSYTYTVWYKNGQQYTGDIKELGVGTYEIRAVGPSSPDGNYRPADTGNKWGTLTVTPAQFPHDIIIDHQAPTGQTGLIWNGEGKVLIDDPGTIWHNIGFNYSDAYFEYSVNYDATTGTGDWYKAPGNDNLKKSAAGTYTVNWRIVHKSGNYQPYASGSFEVTIAKSGIKLKPAPVLATKYDLHYNNTAQNLLRTPGVAVDSEKDTTVAGTIYYSYDFPGGLYGSKELALAALKDPNYHWYTADKLTVKDVAYYHVYYYVAGDDNHDNLYYENGGKYGAFDLGVTIMNPAVINIIANNTWVLYGDSPDNSFSFSVQPLTGYWNRADKDLLGIKYNQATGYNVGEYRVEPVSVEASLNQAYYYDEVDYGDGVHRTHTSYLIGNYMIYDYIAGTLYIEPAPVTVTVADAEKDLNTNDPKKFTYASIEGMKYGESESLITLPENIKRVSYATHAYDETPLEQIVRRDETTGKTIPYEGVLFAEAKDADNKPYKYTEVGTGVWATEDLAEAAGYKKTTGTVRQGNYMVTFVAGNFTINHAVETIPVIQDLWGLHFNGKSQSLLKTVGTAHNAEGEDNHIWYSSTFVPDPNGYDSLEDLNAAVSADGVTWEADDISATTVGAYGTYYYLVADANNTDDSRTYYRYYDEASGGYKYNVWTLGWTYMNPAILTVSTEPAYLLYGQSWENAFEPKLDILSGKVVEDEGELDELFGFTYTKAQGNVVGTYAVSPEAVKAKQCTTPYYIDAERIATEIGHPTYQIGNYLIIEYIPGTLTIEPAPVTVYLKDNSKVFGHEDPDFEYEVTGMQYGESDSLIDVHTPYRTDKGDAATWEYEGERVTTNPLTDVETPHEDVLQVKKGEEKFNFATDESFEGRLATLDNSEDIIKNELGFKENITKGTERQGNYIVTWVSADFTIYYDEFDVTAPVAKTGLAYDHTKTQDLVEYGSVAYQDDEIVVDPATATIWYSVVDNDAVTVPAIGGAGWYKLNDEGEAPEAIKRKPDGTYNVYYWVEVPDGFKRTPALNTTTPIGPIEVTIGTTDAGVEKAPEAAVLTFNDEDQELLADAGIPFNGTIKYKVGIDGTWSTEIPKMKHAGTYDVYYYVDGKAVPNYAETTRYIDYEPEKHIKVTIDKRKQEDIPGIYNSVVGGKTIYVVDETVEDVLTNADVYLGNFLEEDDPTSGRIDPIARGTRSFEIVSGNQFITSKDVNNMEFHTGSKSGVITLKISINADEEAEGYDPDHKVYTSGLITIRVKGQNEDPAADETGKFEYVFVDEDKTYTTEDGTEHAMYVYTGSAIKPQLRVSNGDKTLVQGRDYKVSYKNNVKAYTDITNQKKLATVTVTGIGNYKQSKKLYFVIYPKSLNEYEYDFDDDTYNDDYSEVLGEDINVGNTVVQYNKKIAPIITYKGKVLKEGKDYTIDEPVNKKVTTATGDVTVKITGKGNFVGKILFDIKVDTPRTFGVTLNTKAINFIYNGEAKTLNTDPEDEIVDQLVVTDKKSGVRLTEDVDYSVSYANNVNAGTVTVTITGKNSYKTKVSKKFKIKPATNAKVTVLDEEWLYNDGVPFQNFGAQPDIYLEADLEDNEGVSLTRGVDFKVTYSNNKNVGYGNYKISFIGNYKGAPAITKPFKIYPANFAAGNVDVRTQFNFNPKKKKAGNYFAKPDTDLFVTVGGVLLKKSEYSVSYSVYNEETDEYVPVLKGEAFVVPVDGHKYIEVTVKPTGGNYSGDELKGHYVVSYPMVDPSTDISKAKISVINSDGKAVKPGYTGDAVTPGYIIDENGNLEVDSDKTYRLMMTIKTKNGKIYFTSDGSIGGKITNTFSVKFVNNERRGSAKVIITPNDHTYDDELLGTVAPEYYGTAVGKFTIGQQTVTTVLKNWFDKLASG